MLVNPVLLGAHRVVRLPPPRNSVAAFPARCFTWVWPVFRETPPACSWLVSGLLRGELRRCANGRFCPLYWVLISVGAWKALVQLCYKPHYWEKTIHGYCLIEPETTEEDGRLVVRGGGGLMTSLIRPQEQRRQRHPRSQRRPGPASSTARIVYLVAVAWAVAACVWSARTHSFFLYSDARTHLDIARHVTDALTPGLAQLGSVWLPLPHLLLVPLVASTWMWHSGAAGAIVGGACFVYSAVRVYTLVDELTGSRSGPGAPSPFMPPISTSSTFRPRRSPNRSYWPSLSEPSITSPDG